MGRRRDVTVGPAWQAAAVAGALVCLALATLLFVVSIYMYDRLALPRRYWVGGDKLPRQDLWRSLRDPPVPPALPTRLLAFVFSAAVGMAMLGFLAPVLTEVWPVAAYLSLRGRGHLLLAFRPELGLDYRARMHHGAMDARRPADLPAATFFGIFGAGWRHRAAGSMWLRRLALSRPVLLIL